MLVEKMEKIKQALGVSGPMSAVAEQAAPMLGISWDGKNVKECIEAAYVILF